MSNEIHIALIVKDKLQTAEIAEGKLLEVPHLVFRQPTNAEFTALTLGMAPAFAKKNPQTNTLVDAVDDLCVRIEHKQGKTIKDYRLSSWLYISIASTILGAAYPKEQDELFISSDS